MPHKKNITEEVGSLGALLRLPYLALTERVYGRLAERGYPEIRPAHSVVFRHILPEGSRVTHLAERAHMTKQSMGYLVDALGAAGYVEETPDPDDKRAKLVRLTERGRKAQRMALDLSEEAERHCARLIGQEEVATLRRLLEQLTAALETPASPEG